MIPVYTCSAFAQSFRARKESPYKMAACALDGFLRSTSTASFSAAAGAFDFR